MTHVVAGEVPMQSEIARRLEQSDYIDCRTLVTKKRYSHALACYLAMVGQTPAWVNTMMAMRNKIVSFVGLKNLGHLGNVDAGKPVDTYQVGERVGIFTILYLSDEEVILGDNDRHLDVQVSMVLRDIVDGQRLTNTTVVRNHNLLGQFYMLFVGPAHKVIAPAVMRRLPVS